VEATGDAAAIEVDGLTVDRGGSEILHDLSFSVPVGRVTGLLGPSGCGKTTLIRAIVGVQIIRSGEVRVLGRAAWTGSLRQKVGYVTQAPSIYLDLTVAENLRYFARVLGAGDDDVERVIETVSLGERADHLTANLSGGQRARVSLGTALLGNPDLLLLDEPTVGLDPVLRRELWQTFRELAREGTTFLVSSHVMDEADECDDLLLMRDGNLLATETPQSLRQRTGQDRLDDAFLALIEREGTS
jgi:ABC-2 type transport system ATP-binding protein